MPSVPTEFKSALKPEGIDVDGPLEPEDTDILAETLIVPVSDDLALISPRHCNWIP